MSNKNAVENQSSISLCQPSCGYYFSSGLVISETVYSSASHGAIYNAASRIIIDGGRKALQTAALGGMMMQNLTMPLYAGDSNGITISAGQTSTVSAGELWTATRVSGQYYNSAILNVYGVTSDTYLFFSGFENIFNGGTANGTIIDRAWQYVSSGGIANGTTVNRGGLHIFSRGIANSTIVNSGGGLRVSSGGSAVNISQATGGNVYVSVHGGDMATLVNGTNESGTFSLSNGVASGFILYSEGWQGVYNGGIASGTIVNSGGVQSISNGGSALGTVQFAYGNVRVDVIGGDTSTFVSGTNESGTFSLSNGIASGFILYNEGDQWVTSGGVASGTIVSSGGRLIVGNLVLVGGSALGTVIGRYGSQIICNGGTASNTIINENGSQIVSAVGTANSTTVNANGTQIISQGGTVNNTIINENGSQVISSGGLSLSATINSGGKQYIESSGVASDTTINIGGWQYVSAGGSAINNIINSGALQTVDDGGVVSNTVVESGGSQVISSGGNTSNMIISGIQYVSAGATDVSATILSGGQQHILSDGIANNATVNNSGFQRVSNGGSANSTTVNSGGNLMVSSGGSATNIIQHSGGKFFFDIASGDTTYITGINERGSEFSVINGVASNLIINGKGVLLHDGGILYNYIATSNGESPFGAGGSAINVIQETGGDLSVDVGTGYGDKNAYIGTTYITGTNQYGQSFSLISGVASNFVINEYAYFEIYSGGKAYGTIINSGHSGLKEEPGMTVYSGGSSISTVVNSGGSQLIEEGGYAIYTTVSSGGKQTVESGGMASNTVINENGQQIISSGGLSVSATINSGGSQHIKSAGVASDTTINVGGWQYVSAGGSAVNNIVGSGGSMVVHSGGVVSNTVVESGSSQIISSGGNTSNMTISGVQYVSAGATDISATILSGGQQHILSDGIANNAVLNNKGSQIVSNGGNANSTTVNVGGNQIVHDGASASRAIINTGGLQTVYAGGTVNATDIKGGTQNLSGGRANIVSVINGTQNIYEDGEAYQITLNGGTQNIYDGGMAEDVIINSGAAQNVHSGGSSYSATVNYGGTLNIASGGYASDVVQSSGGNINADVYAGADTYISGVNQNGEAMSLHLGTASGFVLNNGGTHSVNNGGTANNTVVNTGANQWINSGGNASGTVLDGGNMWLDKDGTASALTVNRGTAYITGTHTISGDNSLNNGGKITIARINKATPATLTMQNLGGNGGIIGMNVSLSDPSESDKIIITGTHNGNTLLSLKNVGKSGVSIKDDSLKLVEYSGGAAANGTFSLKGGKFDAGWYEYVLDRGDVNGNGNDYYLRSTEEMTPIARTATAAPEIANVAISVALNSLQKRLGDLRIMGNSDATQGTWARGYYKSITLKDRLETDMKASGMEAGYDFTISNGMYLGLMAGSSNISGIEGKNKSGELESKGEGTGILGGAYLAYTSDSGFFVDLTARAGSNDMDYSAYSATEGKWLDFSPKRTFIAASGEAGIAFDLRHDGTGWKVEPKAEMQYMNVGAKEVEVKNIEDRTIKFGGASYITGIGTLNLAYSWKDGNGLLTEPYAEISYIQAISGEEEVSYAGNTEKVKTEGGTIEGRIGLNMQLTSNLYWHAAATVESGSKRESFGADAGIRYMFGGKGRKTEVSVSDSVKPETVVKETAAEEKVSDSVIVADDTVANTVDETINADNEVRTVVAIRPSDEKFSELNAEEYEKKALEAEKLYEESGTMAIPSAGLLFQIGKSEVLPYYQPMLDSFIKLYKQTDGNAKILIEAYSSNGGNETGKNPELSKQRAKSVYKYLVGNGISKENITVRAYSNKKIGEGVFSEDPNCKAGQCYRRVDIIIK